MPIFDPDAERVSRRGKQNIHLIKEQQMAFNENHVSLSGNLTRDPEVKYTASNLAVMKFGLAVNNRVKKGDDWIDDPMFIDVTVFGKRAEQLDNLLNKGGSVMLSGRLQFRSWESQDGAKHSKHEVIADVIKPCIRENFSKDGPSSRDDDDFRSRNQGRTVPKNNRQEANDDVPF